MVEAAEARQQFGGGPLSRAAAMVYNLLLVELLFLLTVLPGLVPLVLLDRDASNIPLVAACALPIGPALSAALYALRHRSGDLADLHPTTAFWRGYRLNFRAALTVWVPLVIWLAILGVNVGNFAAAGVPGWWGFLMVVVMVSATLWGVNALVITSLFTFRPTDIARLAVYFLVRTPGVTLGNACLLLVAAGVTVVSSELVVVLLASVFTIGLLRTTLPMTARIEKDFTA
jgi:uncharacterized membrane protein YesL